MEEEGNRGWDAGWIISYMYYYISIFREDDVQYGYLYAGAGVTGTGRRVYIECVLYRYVHTRRDRHR